MDENMESFVNAIQSLTTIKEENLTDEVMVAVQENFKQQLSPQMVKQAVNEMIKNMEEQGLTKEEAADAVKAIKDLMNEMIYGEQQYTGNKKKLIDDIIQSTYSIFDQAVEQYHSYNIVLPMTLTESATEPTYAHESDAAADLYASDPITVRAHTYGNRVHTGVNIQLPEGWLALILPRSSTGLKTPLRLSNSVGLIDSGYRGELIALYDNTSDQDYIINHGDRIAQLLVMPSYRFKAEVVESLEDSDRGTGGFGSTGA